LEINLQTSIDAPLNRCFDLARSIDFHVASAASTDERAIGGITSGLIGPGQEVEWEAKHFGIRWKMRVRITEFKEPTYFQDTMMSGPFASFIHDHMFQQHNSDTLMTDSIQFQSPWLVAGWLSDLVVVRKHLLRFVTERNAALKAAAESDVWCHYLGAHPR
jgi:ligand-binding SRPBCC domain-containing protein